MKKFIAGMLCSVVFLSSAAALSSQSIQAILFPSKVTIYNGNEVSSIDSIDGTEIINYKSRAYVPLRSFAEAMGAIVNYEEASETTNNLHKIDIYQTPSLNWALMKLNPTLEYALYYVPIMMRGYHINENEASIGFTAKLRNHMEEDIRISPINLVLEVYAEVPTADEDGRYFEKGPLVYRKSIPTFEGLIPSDYGYEVFFTWDKKGMDGKLISPGRYLVYLHQPEEVNYTTEGSDELKTQRIDNRGENSNWYWTVFK